MDKTFYIGIGSQRAGSTLLHKIIHECTDVFMHPVKELHYYDTLYQIRNESVLRKYSAEQLNSEVVKFCNSQGKYTYSKYELCFVNANRLLALQNLRSFDYLDLYRPCVQDNDKLGEITPEYMILPNNGIEELANTVGSNAYIFLLTRHPVDRFVSAYKLLINYGKKGYEDKKSILDVLSTMPTWIEQQKELSNYRLAYLKYRKYFKNVIVVDYKDLVSPDGAGIYNILSLAGLDYDKAKIRKSLEVKVNNLGETSALNDQALDVIEKTFSHEIKSYNSFLNKVAIINKIKQESMINE